MTTQTILKITDNTGVVFVKCIKLSKTNNLNIGSFITVVVKKKFTKKLSRKIKEIKNGQICNALIVRSRIQYRRWGNFFVSMSSNSAILISKQFNPLGSRIMGPVLREVRSNLKFTKVFNLVQILI